MKRLFSLVAISLLTLLGSGSFGFLYAQVVQVTQPGSNATDSPPSAHFEERWSTATATITDATPTDGIVDGVLTLPARSFYLQDNPSGAFSSTVKAW
jgi:hypothetical protein